MIKNVDLKDILKSSKAQPAKGAGNDLLELLKNPTEGVDPSDFLKQLKSEVGNIEEASSELLNTILNGKNNNPEKLQDLLKSNELIQNPVVTNKSELDSILSQADSQVKTEYTNAKTSQADLDQILRNLNNSSESQVLSEEVQEPLTHKSLIDTIKPQTKGETFYKDAQPVEYRSMFTSAEDKKIANKNIEQVALKNEVGELENMLLQRKSQTPNPFIGKNYGEHKFSSALINKAKSKNEMLEPSMKNIESLLEGNDLPVEQLRSHGQKIVQLDTNPSFINPISSSIEASAKISTPSAVPVMNFSDVTPSASQELINKISDYIVQRQHEARPNVELTVKHQDLGDINIFVSKNANQSFDVAINTQSIEGRQFFSQNQTDLFSSLTRSGLNINDLKLESSSSFAQSSKDGSSREFGGQNFSQQYHQSQNGQSRQESQRRQELWSYYRNQQEIA